VVATVVALPAFPDTLVWSPVLVPEDVPEKFNADKFPAMVKAPAEVILFAAEKN